MWRRVVVGVALLVLAFVPHWRTVGLGELPLPEGYLALLAPDLKPRLRPTPWNALWWDGIGQFWAWRAEAGRQLGEGRCPLWTSRVGCGFPFLANPQTQSLYPPMLLAHWIWVRFRGIRGSAPLWAAALLAWAHFAHTLLALTGTYWLLRSFSLPRLPSLIGAAAFGLGSFQTAWLLLPTLPATAAWLPFVLLCVRRLAHALDNSDDLKTLGWLVGFALSLAMLLLAGHGQIALYALLAVALLALLEGTRWQGRKRFVGTLIVGVVIAFFLASAQLLPTMELAPLAHRHAPPTFEGYRAFAERGMSLTDWATMVLPFLFGNPTDGSYFGKESFADYCAYAGFGIFVLALTHFFAVFSRPSVIGHQWADHGLAVHATALFVLGALLASGSSFNLPLYFCVPGFAQLGTPSRAVFLCQLALGMMAAEALSGQRKAKGVYRSGGRWGVVAVAVSAPIGAIGGVGWWLSQKVPDFDWQSWLGTVVAQNNGIFTGFAAVLLFPCGVPAHLRADGPLSCRSSSAYRPLLFRYGSALLLLAELCWFAAQQLPTARPEMVAQALKPAAHRLHRSLPSALHATPFVPARWVLLGGDWSLVRMPRTLLPPNSLLLFEGAVADIRNYDSLLLRHHKAVLALFCGGAPCPPENGNLILLPRSRISPESAERLAKLVGAVFRENGRLVVGERCFVPQRVRYVPRPEEALPQLPQLPDGEAVIAASPQPHHPHNAPVRLVADFDSLKRMRVEGIGSAFKPRLPFWLVVADTAYPGWRAFCRGTKGWRPLPLAVADGAFYACYLPEGGNDVLWVYYPSSFAVGAFLSCLGLAVVCALSVTCWMRRRERPC